MKLIVVFLLSVFSPILKADILTLSELKSPGTSASCEEVRQFFLQVMSEMKKEPSHVIQYGFNANQTPFFTVDAVRGSLHDTFSIYYTPYSAYDALFLACFDAKHLRPGTTQEHFERLQAVQTCLKQTPCELKLPAVPTWLTEAMTALDSNKRLERSAALKDLLARCADVEDIEEAEQMSLELLAGQKSRPLQDGVWSALGTANQCIRKKIRSLALEARGKR